MDNTMNDTGCVGVSFVYRRDWLLEQVGNITATIAARPSDKSGEPSSWLMLTEDNGDMFDRLLKDAMATVRRLMVTKLAGEHPSRDARDLTRVHIDTTLYNDAAHGELSPQLRIIDDCIRKYLIYRIVCDWLMMKGLLKEAELWGIKAADAASDLTSQLARTGVTRRPIRYF